MLKPITSITEDPKIIMGFVGKLKHGFTFENNSIVIQKVFVLFIVLIEYFHASLSTVVIVVRDF